MRRIAVTGSTGFVGRRVVASLKASALIPVVVARDLLYECLDGTNKVSLSRLGATLTGCEAVVHCAGLAHEPQASADQFHVANHLLTELLARSAKDSGVRRFIYVSSVSVHGRRFDTTITSRTPVLPETPYGVSKARAEAVLQHLANSNGFQVFSLRPPLICGAGASGNLSHLRSAVLRGLPIPTSTWNRRDLIGVRNFSRLVVCALSAKSREPFLALPVCDGGSVSSAQIVRAIARGAGRPARSFSVSRSALRFTERLPIVGLRMQQLCGDLLVDGTEAINAFGPIEMLSSVEELEATGRGRD